MSDPQVTPLPRKTQGFRALQIGYSPQTLADRPAGFEALDNLANERPDWREYWPMRQYLLNNELDEDTLYGFFSPKFPLKTGLSRADMERFMAARYKGEDLVAFSPFWDLNSFFINVFEQGDFFHEGIQAACRAFVKRLGWPEALIDTVMHSRNSVFCNYFLANKKFWTRWLALGEQLFAIAESGDQNDELTRLLNANCRYGPEQIPRKIFVMERLASLLLLVDSELKTCAYDMFRLPPSATPLNQFFYEAASCDALKQVWMQSASPACIASFMHTRNKVLGINPLEPATSGSQPPATACVGRDAHKITSTLTV
jgi:hypothetical protein